MHNIFPTFIELKQKSINFADFLYIFSCFLFDDYKGFVCNDDWMYKGAGMGEKAPEPGGETEGIKNIANVFC